ncbi:YjfB family protein [Methylobacillus gramineus]|uniref:YjfB family protein n=1 Tax=Methylobacillus gramineus TaxID=755169 RepID=UPI001CFF81F2|nr:YjfB family protein [Methylobacillus gramineus]MCB5183876.1 YjfB family protein [Methylobacillus gramineus]
MDINAIANVATELSATKLQQEVGISVLKKALDISSSNALALLQALPQLPSAPNLPDHLGQNVNTTA